MRDKCCKDEPNSTGCVCAEKAADRGSHQGSALQTFCFHGSLAIGMETIRPYLYKTGTFATGMEQL